MYTTTAYQAVVILGPSVFTVLTGILSILPAVFPMVMNVDLTKSLPCVLHLETRLQLLG